MLNQPWMDQPHAGITHHPDEGWRYLSQTIMMLNAVSKLQLVIYKVNKEWLVNTEWEKKTNKSY